MRVVILNILVFVVFLALVLILFIAAEYLDVVLHVGAFALLFILGVTVLTGGLQYKSGEILTGNYTYLPNNTSINISSETRSAVYTDFSGGYQHTIGFLICALSVLGFVLVYTHYGDKIKGKVYR